MAVQNQRLPKDTKNDTSSASAAPPPPPPKSSSSTAAANLSKLTKSQQQQQASSSTPAPQNHQNHHHQHQHHQVSSSQQQQPNANGGPRVSFNRDVHVKRIGKRSNDLTNYETTNLQPPQQTQSSYHQLPADLSTESIHKEAALVLAQAKRHKSIAENGDNIPTFKVKTKRSGGDTQTNPKKFHSLPNRKKKGATGKPVSRSNSDAAAAKKPSKRPSIFSIFSRKSDSNINQVERDPRFEDSGGRRLVRSKSDVGSSNYKLKKVLKDSKAQPQTTTAGAGSQKHLPHTQLSPIIENDPREDCFEEHFSRERRKSEAITDREKHESGIHELLARSRSQAEVDGNFIRTPISEGIKEKILTLQAKSQENMHSSQLPAQKLPLTKGQTVNGMVKRLSMERFSPPPTMMGPAFSYIRPNEGITYAQLELQDDIAPQRNTLTRTRDYNQPRLTPPREYRSPQREMQEDVGQRNTLTRTREYNQRLSPQREYHRHHSPAREYRSMSRDIFTPERELISQQRQKSEDQTDFITSHNSNNNHHSRNQYSPNYNTSKGTTTIHIGGSFSPSPWQQLSPRNLSDEDEGLGLEPHRKYYEEELRSKSPVKRSKSPAEPPIVPKIRSITPPPRENGYRTPERYLSPSREQTPHDDMGYRRARLESRILTRRFGDSNTLERNGYYPSRENSHERVLEEDPDNQPSYHRRRYLSPERELPRDSYEPRFHKPEHKEIINKYSPERSHLDMIAPSMTQISTLPKTEKTSRYKHTKYYDDGHGHGVKEVYERETQFDGEGKPQVRESRHRERLDSFTGKTIRETTPERHVLTDYEPKSLDSQFTSTDQYRSSPENMKRYDVNSDRGLPGGRHSSEDRWHSSLKRDKLQQRSFDKGDSGIENDFRKESFNGDLVTRWRKRTTADDIKSCENFLKKERRYCEHQRNLKRKDNYVYRERSIDDGSHFDPHLDKYPVSSNSTLRRRDQQSQTAQGPPDNNTSSSTLKRTKKLGGFEKVKQLFGGGGGGGNGSGPNDKKDVERKSMTSSTTSSSAGTQQTIKSKDKEKYMVKEEEMRSRYREHQTANAANGGVNKSVGVGTQTLHLQNDNMREPKAIDISMRRRLSTPKASPLLLKRTSSDKNRKESPLAKPEKTSWFKSLDRRAKSKSKEKLNGTTLETSSLKRTKNSRHSTPKPPPAQPTKSLRFFGDTDIDSNPPTISKGNTTNKSRPLLTSSTLNRSQKYSQSAYNLDRIRADSPQRQDYRHTLASGTKTTPAAAATNNNRHKSTSMHNLDNQGSDEVDFRKRRHYSRSRELDDISESGSETEDQQKRPNGGIAMASRTLSRDRLDRTQRYDENTYRRSNDRPTSSTPNGGDTSSSTQHQPRRLQPYLTGPPKPARSAERRAMSYSRERDRFPAESSGTEGESSLHSQRSVVYLHATTVGAIPQPYQLRRRSISRDDLRSNKSTLKNQPLQPMTRTVSRSVSMLAPWKPKLISEGYEINYSQEQNKTMSTLPRKPLQNANSSSTLTRTTTTTTKKSEPLHSSRTRRHDYTKDDQSSLRNSSTTSASKSALSTNLHRKH